MNDKERLNVALSMLHNTDAKLHNIFNILRVSKTPIDIFNKELKDTDVKKLILGRLRYTDYVTYNQGLEYIRRAEIFEYLCRHKGHIPSNAWPLDAMSRKVYYEKGWTTLAHIHTGIFKEPLLPEEYLQLKDSKHKTVIDIVTSKLMEEL